MVSAGWLPWSENASRSEKVGTASAATMPSAMRPQMMGRRAITFGHQNQNPRTFGGPAAPAARLWR